MIAFGADDVLGEPDKNGPHCSDAEQRRMRGSVDHVAGGESTVSASRLVSFSMPLRLKELTLRAVDKQESNIVDSSALDDTNP